MIPRKDLVIGSGAVGVKGSGYAAVCHCLLPDLIMKALAPAVKFAAQLPCPFNDRGQPPIAAGKYRLQQADLVGVPADFDLLPMPRLDTT